MLEDLYARSTPVRRPVAAEDAALMTLGTAGFGHLAFTLPAPAAAGAVVALGLLGGAAAAKYVARRRWT